MLTTELEVVEGGKEEYVEIKCTLPPRFRCDDIVTNQTCFTDISVSIELDNKDPQCVDPESRKIPQAVVGRAEFDATEEVGYDWRCGLRITDNNW